MEQRQQQQLQQQQQQISSARMEQRTEQRFSRQITSTQQVQGMVMQSSPQLTFGNRPGDVSPPVFEQIFRNARFAQGGNALFEGKVRGNPKPVVSWTRKGAPLLESNKYKMKYDEQTGNVSLLINAIGPGDEGEYTCTARNQYGEAICSVYIQPEGQGQIIQQPPGGYQREFTQTVETSEQRTTQQRYQKQTTGKISYANGHIVEEDFKVDTFEYRLLREVEFRESITRRFVGEVDREISTVVDRSLGPVAPPQIAQKPRNSKLQEGTTATFQAKVPANPRPRITWFKNGQRITQSQKYESIYSNQQAVLKINSLQSEDSGHYTLLAENPQGCVVSSAYLAVEASATQDGLDQRGKVPYAEPSEGTETGKALAPNFVRVCNDRDVTEGKMTRFDCRVTGRPYPEVAWLINGQQVRDDATHKVLVNESGNHALMITNVSITDAGVITCVARNKAGETSFQCNLNVIEKEQVVAPKFVERFSTVHVKEGEPVVLKARAVGTPIPRISWQKDGVPLAPGPEVNIHIDGGASTLDIPRAKASDAAWYQCTAQNVAGSTATRARLFVETPKGATPPPRRLNLPRPTKVIEPEPEPGPEVIYLRHVERAKPHMPLPEEERIYPPPQFIIPLNNAHQVEGGRVHFEARIEPVGDPSMKVEWFVNGRPLAASSRATATFQFGFIALDLISIQLEDSGEYVCRVSSNSGSVESHALLSVTGRVGIEQSSQHPDSLQYIQHLEDYSRYQRTESIEEVSSQRPNFIRPLQELGELQEGRNAHFEGQLTPVSDPTMRVEWFKDGKPITASSRITTIFNFGYVSLNILHLRAEDAGTYTVRAVNRTGEAISSSTLKVQARTSVTTDLGIPEQQRYIEKVEELEAYQQYLQSQRYVQEPPESTAPPEFKSLIKDQLNIREGGFAHFEARLEPIGDSTLRVEWLKDGKPVEASSRITSFFNFGYVALTIKSVTTHDIGTYSCRAINTLGEAVTSAKLTVVSKKDIIMDSQHPGGLEKIQYLEDTSRYGRSLQEETTVTKKPMFLGPLKGTNKIVEGQRAHFEARVEPQHDTTLQIEWYFNGKVIMTANRIQTYHDFGYVALDILGVRAEDAGTYTVVARNALGEAQLSASMVVETRSSIDTTSMHRGTYEKTQRLEDSKFVEPSYHIEEISKSKPIFVQPLSDPKPISEGKNIHLECRLEPMGDPTMRVEWFYNGRPITVGSRFRTYYDFGYVALDIVQATSMDSGEYTVRATNHLGSAHTSACVRVISRSDILTETQNESALEQIQYLEDASRHRRTVTEDVTVVQAPQFTRPLHNIETVEGTNIHLECRLQPVGDPTMRVEWLVNGQPVKTGHRFRPAYDFDYVALDLLSVYPVDSGVYTCVARNQLGEAVTSCSVKIIAKKDLILETQHPSGLEKIQYLEDTSRYRKTEYMDEVVNVRPRFITKPKNLDNMREGQHAHFECKLEPVTDPNLKVEWYKNGRPVTVGHRFRPIHDFGYVALDIIDLIAEDSGTYTCRAVNLLGSDETTCVLNCRSTAQILTGTQNETGLEQIQYLEDKSRYQRSEYIEETTKQAPIFTTSLKHMEIKEGQRAHFECRLIPVSDPTMKVEWFHNNVPVKSGSRFTETNNFGFVALDIMYCYPEDSGTYTCRAKNIVGEAMTSANLTCISKKSIYMETQHEEALSKLTYLEDTSRHQRQTVQEETVTQAPMFTQPMKDVRVAENQAMHFEARLIPVGDPKLRVEWLRNGVPIQASNRVTTMHDFGYVALNMKYVYPEDSGTYTCRAINELGQAVTSATLVVHSKASLLLESQHEAALQKLQQLEDTSRYQRREEEEIIVTQPPKFTAQLNGPTELIEGHSAHYECRIEPYPDPNMRVEWFHNGKPLQLGHRFRTTYDFGFAALDILTVYPEDSGEYTCKATNKLGQASSSIKVNVKSRSSIIMETQHEGALQKIQYLEDDSRYKRTAVEEQVIAEKPQFGRPLRNIDRLPEGQSAHLEATLTPVNDPTMRVEWFCNGRPIPQGHRFKTTYDFGYVALDILYAYAEDSGTYMCKARNAVGEAVTTCSVTVEAKSGLYLDTLDENRLKKIKDLETYERPQKPEVEPEMQKPVFITPLVSLENLKEGEHAHLECRVEPINDPNLKIEWFVNGIAIKTGHRFRTTHDFGYVALDILYTYAEDSGTYMCKATNLVGEAVNTCQITVGARRSIYLESQHPEGLQKIQELEAQGRPARLEVEEPEVTPPRFVTELRGTTEIFEGQTAHFEAQVEPLHDPNLRIEFYHNGKPLPSASRFHITFDFGYLALDITHAVPEDAGEYTAKAINALGQCTSTITLRVTAKSNIVLESQRPEGLDKIRALEQHVPYQRPEVPEPTRQRPVFTQPLQNIDSIAEGQTAHFECRLIPVGDPTLKVEWFRNEKPLETSSRITKTHDFGYVALDMTHVRAEDDGVYMCRASNALGEAVTTASMKIKTKADIQLETQHPQGMKRIQQLEEGKAPVRPEQPEQEFDKPIFTQVLTGPSELWEGQHAHFECRVVPVGDPNMRYEWYINGKELKLGSRFHVTHDFGYVNLDINSVISEDSGVYMCKAINKAGEAVSSISLKVKTRSSIIGDTLQPDAWQKIQLKEAEMNKVPPQFVDTSPQQAPVFTTHLTSHDKLVEGQNILLEAQVEPRADPNLRVEWFKNGKPLATGTRLRTTFDFGHVSLSVTGLRADDSAIYTCKASNLLGEAVSTCTLKVEDRHWLLAGSLRPEALPKIEALEEPKAGRPEAPEPTYESPVFITHLNNVVCTEGDSVHFECHVEPSKDPTLNIEWFINGKPLPTGARYKSTYDFGYVALDIIHAYAEDSGVYSCKATNSKGQAATSGTLKCTSKQDIYLQTQHPQGEAGLEAVREVEGAYLSKYQQQPLAPEKDYPKPIFVVPLPEQVSLNENEALHVECQVEPKEDPNLKVEWFFNGKPLEHATRFKTTCDFGFVTLDLTDVYERDQGIYTCKATNLKGEAFTSTTIYCKGKESLIERTQHPKGAEGLEKIQDLEESLRRQEGAPPEAEEGHPPVFTSQFQNLKNLSEGEIAHFEASLTPVGDQTMTVEWFYKGEVLKASHRIRTVHAFGMVVLEILGTKIEDSGNYTCRATNKWGRAEISVELECVDKSKGQKPHFTTHIQSLENLKEGESAHFECTLTPVGDPNLKVEWFHNGQPLRHSSRIKSVSDFGFVVMDISYVQSHDTGEYVCRASNKYGEDFTRATIKCSGRGGVYLDSLQPDALARIREMELSQGGQPQTPTTPVLEPPVFTTHISDITNLVEGQSAHFEARLTPVNDPNLTVEWFYNGKKLPHGHRYRTFHDFGIVILDILYCYEENSGVYECRAVNKVGQDVTKATLKCVSKANLILDSQLPRGMEGGLEKIQSLEDSHLKMRDEKITETKGQAPVFTVPLSNVDNLREGESAHFEARLIPTDDPKLKVEWFWNGKPLRTGSRFRTFCDFGFVILEISPVYPEDSGEYSCRAFNEYGEAVTTASMKVQGKRSIILESQLPKSMEHTIEKIAELEGLGSAPAPVAPEEDAGKPPEFITTPSDLTLTENSLAHFECRLIPINDPSMRVEWFHNGKPLWAGSRIKTINDFGFVILEVAGVYQRDSGLYTCKATNKHGEATVSCQLQVRSRQGIILEPQLPTNFKTGTESIQKLEEALYKKDEIVSEEEKPNPPRFTVELKDIRDVQEGAPIHFECRVEPVGDPTMRIDWFHNGRPFATGSRVHMLNDFGFIVLDMDYTYARDSGEYVCCATNKWGSATTKATLTCKAKRDIVLESQLPQGISGEKLKELERGPVSEALPEEAPASPPKFITQITSVGIGEGEPVHFECRVEPRTDPKLRVEWYRNGKPLPSGHRFRTVYDMGFVSLDILYTYPEDSGEYVCRAVNDLGEDTTKATVSCKKLPTIILQNQVPKGMKKSEALMQMEATIKKYTSEIHLTEDDLYDPDKKQPPRFVTQIQDQTTLVEMQTTKFECQLAPVGDPNMKVEWFLNGKPLPHKNRFTPIYDFGYVAMNFGWVYPEDSGEYLCRATNLYGMDETRAVIRTAGKPGIIYESQLPKGMKSIERIREMEAAWQIAPEEPEEETKPRSAPVFVTKPEPYTTTEGEPARFCCRVTGHPRPRLMWVVNGQTVVNGTRYRLTYDGMWHLDIPKTRQYDHGKIEIIARNSAGEAIATTDLTVKPRMDDYRGVLKNSPRRILGTKEYRKPEWVTQMELLKEKLMATQSAPTFVQEIRDNRVKEMETVTFECHFSGTPLPDITWYKDGKVLRNTRNIQIRIRNNKTTCQILKVTPEDKGTYICKAISEVGAAETKAELFVQELTVEEREKLEVKKGKEKHEKIKLERVKTQKKPKTEEVVVDTVFETESKREIVDIHETHVLESTAQFAEKTEKVTAQKIFPVQDSVEISAIASCKKVDDTTEKPILTEEKAKEIIPVQESVTVSEVDVKDDVKYLTTQDTQVTADTKVNIQESVSVSTMKSEDTVKEFEVKHLEEQASRKVSVQESVSVSEVIAEDRVVDLKETKPKEEGAVLMKPVQESFLVTETLSETTITEIKDTKTVESAEYNVPILEPMVVSEIQTEATVEEVKDTQPKSYQAKPDESPVQQEVAEITEIKVERAPELVKREEQVLIEKKKVEAEEIVTEKKKTDIVTKKKTAVKKKDVEEEEEEIIVQRALKTMQKLERWERVKQAQEVDELLHLVPVQEFGPESEKPLRELARVGWLLRRGLNVQEVTALHRAGHFHELRTPLAQSALVSLVERKGHGILVSQALAEEDEVQGPETAGFRAFLRMIELESATVEQAVTLFAPEDFRPGSWEVQEATEVMEKTHITQQAQVIQQAEVHIGDEKKVTKKKKTKTEVEKEEDFTLSIVKETEVFQEGVEEILVTELQEGDVLYSVSAYEAENEDAMNLVEGEKVYIIDMNNPDWWFVKKHLTEEKGWVPAQLLMDEIRYTTFVQKVIQQKIDQLPVFEKPTDKVTAPRFVEKLQPKHAPDGTTVEFQCQISGSPRPQVTWFKQTAILLPSYDFQMFYNEDNVATLVIREVFPEDAGTYTCVAKNTAGFASSSTELIVEGPLSDHGSDVAVISRKSLSRESSLADILEGIPPMFTQKPVPLSVEEGCDVKLDCQLVAVPEPVITWYFNKKEIDKTENVSVTVDSDVHMYFSKVSIKKVKKSQEGVYEVIARNTEGETSMPIMLKVKTAKKEPPTILEPLKPTVVHTGDPVVLRAVVTGNPTPKVTWLKDGLPADDLPVSHDGDLHSIFLKDAGEGDAGLYTVRAENPVGSAETTASLVVEAPDENMEPPLFTERFEEVKVPEKGTLRLVAKVTGNPVPEITWLRNNRPLKPSPNLTLLFDGTTSTLEIQDVDSEVDAGNYKCIAKNPAGIISHGARVSVDVPQVTFVRKLQEITEVEEREALVLECETSHTVSTHWFHEGHELSGMDHRVVVQEGRIHRLQIKNCTSRDAGLYQCRVRDQMTEGHVTVHDKKPEFVRKLQDFEVKERESAILEVEITSETAEVTWHKDGEQLTDTSDKFVFEKQGTVRKLLIRGVSVHDEGEYTCALGEQECTAEVSVVELPPEITTKMQDVTVAKGEKATFEIELTKGDALVRWFKDGKELQFSEHVQLSIDGKRQRLKVYNSELKDAGVYSCEVGEQTSSACLTVEEPAVQFLKKLPDVTLIPLNLDATFTVELSRSDVDVKWLMKGKEIKSSERYQITSEGSVKKLVVKNVTIDDQMDYSCVALNVKSTSKLKVEIIETPPKINIESLKKEYRAKKGDDVTIEVKFTAAPPPQDEWFINGKLVKKSPRITQTLTENSATLTIKKAEERDAASYTVKLSNTCGEASAEMTLVLMEPPSEPGIPEVVEVTDQSITLHWKPPEFNGHSPITNYILEYHDKTDFTWIQVKEVITETTHKVSQLQTDAEYMFRVSAENDVGRGPPSHNTHYIRVAKPVSAEPPTIQKPLEGVVCGLHQSITLSCVIGGIPEPTVKWMKDGKVFKSKNLAYENRIAKCTISETTETSSGIYTCQATNTAGFAETSCELKIQEPPKLEFDESLTTQKLRITNQWKIEVKYSGFPKPEVVWTKNGKSLASTKHCSIYYDEYSSTIAIYSLAKVDTGTYTFTARSEAGTASVDFSLKVIDKPSKPEGPIIVKDIRKDSVVLEWKPPADDGGLELSKYSVEKCDVEKMVWMKVADVEKDVSSYCVQRLREDSEYMFRIIAENPVGTSEPLESDPVTIRSKLDKPSAPRGPLDISGMTETSFTVGWQPPESDGGAPVLEYVIERREVGKKAWQKVGSTAKDVTHIEVSGLKTNTSHHVRITARNEIGLSVPYAPDDVITVGMRIRKKIEPKYSTNALLVMLGAFRASGVAGYCAPSAPTNLNITDITSKSVTLQWGPPASTGGTELTGYIIEKRELSSKKWSKAVTLEPTVFQYCIENLKDRAEYFFRVYAENAIGLSPPAGTDLVYLKKHATVPSPPTAPLEIRPIGPNAVVIAWGIPETDGGAPLQGYTIAIRDVRKTMWMEVGRVKADVHKLTIKDLQENHEYLIRIFAKNEVGPSEPLESEEPFKMLRPTEVDQLELDKLETTAPTLSFSTETTTSWMKEAGMDADIRSYARGSLLRRDEYFFRIWYYARQLFK